MAPGRARDRSASAVADMVRMGVQSPVSVRWAITIRSSPPASTTVAPGRPEPLANGSSDIELADEIASVVQIPPLLDPPCVLDPRTDLVRELALPV